MSIKLHFLLIIIFLISLVPLYIVEPIAMAIIFICLCFAIFSLYRRTKWVARMESRLQLIKRNYPLSHLKHGLPDVFCEDTISETHLNLIKRSDGLWILDEEELITVKIAENKQFLELCESVDLQINSSGILQHDNQYDFSDFRARHEAWLFTANWEGYTNWEGYSMKKILLLVGL